jgi:tryptophanyl-tRNA synthetase
MKKLILISKGIKKRFSDKLKRADYQLGIEPSKSFHLGTFMILEKFNNLSIKNSTSNNLRNKIVIRDLISTADYHNCRNTPLNKNLEETEKTKKETESNPLKENEEFSNSLQQQNLSKDEIKEKEEFLKKYNIELKESIFQTVAFLLAMGVNPETTDIVLQSELPMLTEILWIQNSLVPLHYLHNMENYKLKKNNKATTVGIFLETCLKNSEYLLFNPEKIVLGQNQNEVISFNNYVIKKINECLEYGLFKPADAHSFECFQKLDNCSHKMTKKNKWTDSDKGVIYLQDEIEVIDKKITKAKTDCTFEVTDSQNRKELQNLIYIYSFLSDKKKEKCFLDLNGTKLKEFKIELSKLLCNKMTSFQTKFDKMKKNEDFLRNVLDTGLDNSLEHAYKNVELFKKLLFMQNKYDN